MKKKIPVVFFALLTALLMQSAVMAAVLFRYSAVCSISLFIVAIILIVVISAVSVSFFRNSIHKVSKMNEHLEHSTSEYINYLPAPIAVIDENGRFAWYNQIFSEKIGNGSELYGTEFEKIVNLPISSIKPDKVRECVINDTFYKIYAKKYDENGISLLVVYFSDETDYIKLRKSTDEEKPCVVIMTIDSYDEIMQNSKESEKAQASVETEKLIEKFMNGRNGIIHKTSSNTFIAIIENRHLEELIEEKFSILDSAREITIASKYQLTFSIGVGHGASTIAESEQIARQCLDMALGRGGDQAVIKTDTGYRFFGGVSKGVEKKSKAKTRIISNALQDLILNSERVFLMGHRFGDLDSVGAACGMAGAVRLLGKEAHITVDRGKNLAVNLINIVEEKSGKGLFVSPSDAVSMIKDGDLLIIVDTHNKDFLESRELYERAKNVVVIDHHRKNVNYIDNAVIFLHEPYASSACEMTTEIIEYFRFMNDRKLESYYAEALLSGIMLDTKSFVMRTGVRTFEAAAYLRKSGADTIAVKQLFSNSFESYKHKTQIVASANIYGNSAIATADFKSDDIRIAAPQAADELLGISGVDASYVIYKTGSTVNISARSLGAVNVQVIMEKIGGGGHQTMAATQLEDITIQEASVILRKAIDEREEEISEQTS